MKPFTQQIIDLIIAKKAFLNDYPKPGVIFLAIDSLFNDPLARNIVSKAITASINPQSFDGVAGIASRGYLFSGMIASTFGNKGEFLVQKVKSETDTYYVKLDAKTEYSSDALQVLKNTIKKGKKYLLTDDLIATGGSVMSAIKLIRQCGGIVDTVLVMTELTDFNAKAKLKEEGVELISLLKFTQNDLKKLLVIQKCYTDASPSLITYQLTHHTKGGSALIHANQGQQLTIHLASKAQPKNDATQLAFQGMFSPLQIEVITHDSPSGVSARPFGYTETILGATNRLNSVEQSTVNLENIVLVSMENGIRYDEDSNRYYDFVHVIVKIGEMTYSHTQDCCEIPKNIIDAIILDETWGETAKRLGLAELANDPHKEQAFGGISRNTLLLQALCKTLVPLKENMMKIQAPEIEVDMFNVPRLIDLKNKKMVYKNAKRGIFSSSREEPHSRPINFYNQGCPVVEWEIDPKKVARNSFQIFATGDAFSVMSPNIAIGGANINIHVGTTNDKYSPLVMLQEALQLCRCAYEHGARSITIALPDKFHPVAHFDNFNHLLLNLFKVSGANKVFYYDESYVGKLEETDLHAVMPFTPIEKSHLSSNLDNQVMDFTHDRQFNRVWSKFDPTHNESLPEISVAKIDEQEHVLLCCKANKPLAEKIAASLRMQGEMVRLYHIEGEAEHAKIPEDAKICGAIVTIIQSTRPNPDNIIETSAYKISGSASYFFEVAMIARQAHLRGAETINLINPYQFGARSDKAENNTKGRTGAYVQQNGALLEAAGINHVITAECHDNHTMSGAYTRKKIRGSAVAAISTITTKLATEWLNDEEHPMQGKIRLVTPDAGAAKRTKELTEQLQVILGASFCQKRVLGEKQRDSHNDDSALVSSLNSGSIKINPHDRYLITDDEIATGGTLCQAVANLSTQGAKEISVVVVHNNMPLDWLLRQVCLARFFYLGVNDLHFSDTNEMGTLAESYDDLIATYANQLALEENEVKTKVLAWFKENIADKFSDISEHHINQEFIRFQSMFNELKARTHVHTLADEFASQVITNPYLEDSDIPVAASIYTANSGLSIFAGNATTPAAPSKILAITSPRQ